jgi:hypothetical protein
MKFKEFEEFSRSDISRFEEQYGTMLDLHGSIVSDTIGFHFSLGEPGEDANARDLFDTFKPITIWCGKQEMVERVRKMGYHAEKFSYFEDGGFAVVLKTPRMLKKS